MFRTALVTAIPVLLLAACKEPPPAAPNAASRLVTTATVAENLGERLVHEARSRPTDTPSAEAVHDALVKGGIELGPLQQLLGLQVGARYCAGAHTPSNLGVSICEYTDHPTAVEGRQYSLDHFPMFKNRTIVVNQKTTVTIAPANVSPASQDEVAKAAKIFSSL